MKRLLLSLVLLFSACRAADLTFTFDGNNPPNTVDYVLQELINTAWHDIATSKETTILVQGVNVGHRTYRVIARRDGLDSLPSNEVSVVIKPDGPRNLRITITNPST